MKGNKLWLFALAGGLVIGGVLAAYAIAFWGNKPGGPAEWGMFGDFVGGLANPLLGFLTIFLLIVSLYYQTQELAATREELAQSKEAMRQANGLHDNNLLLQSRNNLRLQLERHFQETLQGFEQATIKDFQIQIKGLNFSCNLRQFLLAKTGKSPFGHPQTVQIQQMRDWDEMSWRNIAAYIRPVFLRVTEAFVALIEYSDSELITDAAASDFYKARNLIKDSGIYGETDLAVIDSNIQSVIKKREEMPFPAYHKKTKVY